MQSQQWTTLLRSGNQGFQGEKVQACGKTCCGVLMWMDGFAPDAGMQIDRDKYEALVRKAEEFIVKRFLSRIPADSQTTPIVHIIKV
jgi:hypothetical protein